MRDAMRGKALSDGIEDFGQGDDQFGILGPQSAVLGFIAAFRCVHEGAARTRVDYPDIRYAEGQIIVDALLHAFYRVVLGQDFDAYKRGLGYDRFARNGEEHYTQVRNPESSAEDLYSLLDPYADIPLFL